MSNLDGFVQRFINQRAAIEHIERFLDLRDPTRGLIVCGREQCGKSFLLEWFLEEFLDHIIGEDIIDIGDQTSPTGLVYEVSSGLQRAGIDLPAYESLLDTHQTIYLNAVVKHADMSGATNSTIQAEARLSQSNDILLFQAKEKIRAIETDLHAIGGNRPELILLVDNLHQADGATGSFLERHLLRTLGRFEFIRFVVAEGGENSRLANNAVLQRDCPSLQVRMRPIVSELDIVKFMQEHDDWVVTPEKYEEVACRLIEDSLGKIPAVRSGLDRYQGRAS